MFFFFFCFFFAKDPFQLFFLKQISNQVIGTQGNLDECVRKKEKHVVLLFKEKCRRKEKQKQKQKKKEKKSNIVYHRLFIYLFIYLRSLGSQKPGKAHRVTVISLPATVRLSQTGKHELEAGKKKKKKKK